MSGVSYAATYSTILAKMAVTFCSCLRLTFCVLVDIGLYILPRRDILHPQFIINLYVVS